MKKYIKYIKGNWIATIAAPILMLIDVIGGLAQPYLMSKIIDVGIANQDKAYILQIGGLMVLTSFIVFLAGFGCMYFSAKAAYGFSANLREDMMSKIQEFSFNNINKFKTSSLITRLTNDVQVITQLFQMILRIVIRAPFMFIGGLVMTLILSKKLSIILLILIPIILILIIVLLKVVGPLFEKVQKSLDKVNSIIRENLRGVRVIKSFVQEQHEKERFNSTNNELKNISIKSYRTIVLMSPLISFLMNITIAVIIWFGAKLIVSHELEIGSLSSSIMYIIMTLSSLIMMAMVFVNFARAGASSKRIVEVLDEKPDIVDKKKIKSNYQIKKGLVEYNVQNFVFTDSSGEEVLHNIKFTISPGDVVAIIGGTGSGKSTLINLMPRFYDVSEGYVKIDGINVKDYQIKNLRNGIGMVLQENKLFKGTIRSNLKWGNEKATDKQLVEACKIAQIHDFIKSLDDKYDSKVEQHGNNFSGGQKQRLCIARALLKKPKILILDDSVSALDATTEKKLSKALKNNFTDMTVFIITQRISSCRNADYVIVLEEGTVVGIGNHKNLLKSNKIYQEINSSQEEVISHE